MKKRALLLVLFILSVCGCLASAMDMFNYGGALRLRQEYWQDVFDLNKDLGKDENFYRLKTTIWGQYNYNKYLDIYLRLANEMRYYGLSNTAFNQDSANGGSAYDMDEGVIDNLYVEARELFGNKLDIKVGRQDFLGVFGEGFLIMDGTPVDGSRTYYFNAAKATMKINPRNSVDFVYIMDNAKDKMLLFDDHRAPRAINTSDEEGAVIYGRMQLSDKVLLEPYFINKVEFTIPNKTINTFGARAVDACDPWKVRGELALQSGQYDDAANTKVSAMGGYAYLTRSFKETKFSPELEVGAVYLSGDDPSTTGTNEGWDPLFSRWPWMSELYVLSYKTETGIVGDWTNLIWYRVPQLKLQFNKDTSFTGSYNLLYAPQNDATNAIYSAAGKNRGQITDLLVRHVFSAKLSAYLQFIYFTPGDYYVSAVAPGPATFTRWNVDYKF